MSAQPAQPARPHSQPRKRRKLCFVTVGATAPFDDLVTAALSIPFLLELATYNYTHLRIQYGRGADTHFQTSLNASRESYKLLKRGSAEQDHALPGDIQVTGFDLATDADTLRLEIRQTQASGQSVHDDSESSDESRTSDSEEGLFISHAGTGSLIDGLAFGIPMVLVPNTALADNHQQELAQRFEEMHYCVGGGVEDLPSAVCRAEEWRIEMRKPVRTRWKSAKATRSAPPSKQQEYSKTQDAGGPTLQHYMDQETIYTKIE